MSEESLFDQGFVRVCGYAQVPEIMPYKAIIDGRSVLICRTPDGGVSAVDEMCPHKVQSMAFGVVHEGKIICPHHQYAFDLETGKSSMRRCPPVEVFQALVQGDEVYVKLP